MLHQKGQIRAATWTRPDSVLAGVDDAGEEILEAGLFDLISAFKDLLERRRTLIAHEVPLDGQDRRAAHRRAPCAGRRGSSRWSSWSCFALQREQGRHDRDVPRAVGAHPPEAHQVYQRGVFGAIRVFRPIGPAGVAAEAAQEPGG